MYLGRILSWVKEANVGKLCLESSQSDESENINSSATNKVQAKGVQVSSFLPTSRRIVQFSNGKVSFRSFAYIILPNLNVKYRSLT